ncbi:hypothetical protein [Thermococcus sp. JCM 11816]|uniref:hypothetical protein n=1 Tax=Thermococcus sp. (strain JCM 11816 / KS-1) TaxID=1295125 RepID=UPI0006D1949C
MSTRSLSLPEEIEVKLEEARAAWEARKVQVLIEDDDVPENASNLVPLEQIEEVLQGLPVPTKLYVDGRVYKIKLRKRVSREEYKAILETLQGLSRAWWDKREHIIKVLRYEEAPAEEEVPEVPVIVPGQGEVGTMHGGGVE